MTDDLISDPIAGIELCNKHIRKLEMMIEESRLAGDIKTATTSEWHLAKWVDLLQHFITQKFQQGLTTTDITTASKKSRVNA